MTDQSRPVARFHRYSRPSLAMTSALRLMGPCNGCQILRDGFEASDTSAWV